MEDFFADLYDDDNNRNEDDGEPSFSLYEFKKWLSKQNKKDKDVDRLRKKAEMKEKLKERFSDKMRKRKN